MKLFASLSKSWWILYIPKLFLVIMQLLVFTKQENEEDNSNKLMVCDIESVIRDLTKLANEENQETFLEYMNSYNCSKYQSLPEAFVIDTTAEKDTEPIFYDYPTGEISEGADTENYASHEEPEPEYSSEEIHGEPEPEYYSEEIHQEPESDYYSYEIPEEAQDSIRKKRSINLGVPTDETFDSEIAMLVPDAFHQYIVLGGEAKFDCFGDESEYLSYYHDGLITHLEWSFLHGEPITSPGIIIDRAKGTLYIPSAQIRDSAIYECYVELSENSLDKPGSHTFTHQLSVVTEKTYSMIINAKYSALHCNEHEMNKIQLNIPKWISTYICSGCEIYGESIKCIEDSETESIYQVHFTISTLGLELQMEHEKTIQCDITCLEIIQEVILENIRNSIEKFLMVPIEVVGTTPEHRNHHSPILPYDLKLLIGCLGGFELNHKLCFPCNPGSFSENGETNCNLCPMGSYQQYPGATGCLPCQDGETTSSEGSKTKEDCVAGTNRKYLIYMLIGLSCIILIIIILLLIYCCCPATGIGIIVSRFCCCCCSGSKSKSSKYKQLDEEEMLSDTKERKYDKKVEIRKRLGSLKKTNASLSKLDKRTSPVVNTYNYKDKVKLKNIKNTRSKSNTRDNGSNPSADEEEAEKEDRQQIAETCEGCDGHIPHKCIKPSPFRALLKHSNRGENKTNNFTPPIPPKMPDVPLYL